MMSEGKDMMETHKRASGERRPAVRGQRRVSIGCPASLIIHHSSLLILLLPGCGDGNPFSHEQVSGKVTYEDGSVIPYGFSLQFYPQREPLDARTHPRMGTVEVDPKTGEFSSATTYQPNDGLVRGKHKVTIISTAGMIPPEIVPPEYTDVTRTPLEVDTHQQPFELRIRKPR